MKMKKLSRMTAEEVKNELSIAGSPGKLIAMMHEIFGIMRKIDKTNAAELINLDFILRKLQSEVGVWIRDYEGRTGQKIH